jgi:hypothetical protein
MKKDFWMDGLVDEWIVAHGWMRSNSPIIQASNNPFIPSIYEQPAT